MKSCFEVVNNGCNEVLVELARQITLQFYIFKMSPCGHIVRGFQFQKVYNCFFIFPKQVASLIRLLIKSMKLSDTFCI